VVAAVWACAGRASKQGWEDGDSRTVIVASSDTCSRMTDSEHQVHATQVVPLPLTPPAPLALQERQSRMGKREEKTAVVYILIMAPRPALHGDTL
jgi:hypothetical protein